MLFEYNVVYILVLERGLTEDEYKERMLYYVQCVSIRRLYFLKINY